jgi:hypothetical protein
VIGRVEHVDRAGRSRISFDGVIGGRRLAPGRYELTAVARNANGTSAIQVVRFRIVG